jgi:hypothetical protein
LFLKFQNAFWDQTTVPSCEIYLYTLDQWNSFRTDFETSKKENSRPRPEFNNLRIMEKDMTDQKVTGIGHGQTQSPSPTAKVREQLDDMAREARRNFMPMKWLRFLDRHKQLIQYELEGVDIEFGSPQSENVVRRFLKESAQLQRQGALQGERI